MVWTSKDFVASHILFVIIEDSYLAQLWSWVAVTGSKLSILVIAPSIQVRIMVKDMAEV